VYEKNGHLFFLLAALAISAGSPTSPPEVEITNGNVKFIHSKQQ